MRGPEGEPDRIVAPDDDLPGLPTGFAVSSTDVRSTDAAPDLAWRSLYADLLAVDLGVNALLTADTGLLGVQADMMLRLWRHPERRSPMNALAGDMRVSGSSLTKLVDRLSDLDLARRDASESDRRVVYVVLTPAGESLAADLYRRYAAVLRARVLAVVGDGLLDLSALARRLA